MSDAILGNYRLLAELGRGGMADVYLAVRNDNAAYFAKLVVIKKLKEHLAFDTDFMTMLIDEARIAARLNHPNLVQTIEIGEYDEQHFLTMEYLDGQPLHRILNRARGRFSRQMYLSVLTDVLNGIQYAHDLKDFDGTPLDIVHRDVTPHNVFVTYEGQVKVVDFGIAKAAGRSSETRHGVVKGKVAYMAPEQASGATIDRRVDVFAIGVMAYEAAIGARMWKGVSETDILRRLLSGDVPTSPRAVDATIDEELDRICQRALAFSPDDRYPTAAAFQRDLEAYLTASAARSSPRELGGFVAELFADKREKTAQIIAAQLSQLRDQPPRSLPALPTTSEEVPVEDLSPPPAEEPEPGPSPRMSYAPLEPPEAPTDWLSSLGTKTFAAALVAIFFVVVIAASVLARSLMTSDADSAAAAAAAEITVTLRATPLETRFAIDDGPLLDNPYIGRFPRDAREHRVRALAPGFVPIEKRTRFDDDVSVKFTLTPSPSSSK